MIDIGSLSQGIRSFSHEYQCSIKNCQLGILITNFKWL